MTDQARAEAMAPPPGFSELVREGCEGYVLHGIGLPWPAYIFHAIKLGLLVLAWMFFCSFTPGLGSPWTIGSWWLEPIAFQKAFIFACMVEVLGFGCMSGPLGFHIWPPFTAFLHFFRPGTTKLAPFPTAVMEACYSAAVQLYDETSAKNPKFKKVYDSWKAFRNEQVLWFRVAENTFDNFMARTSAQNKL